MNLLNPIVHAVLAIMWYVTATYSVDSLEHDFSVIACVGLFVAGYIFCIQLAFLIENIQGMFNETN